MSNFTDEKKFNEFVKSLTWEGSVEKIQHPFLVVAGEFDELSPLEHTDRMLKTMKGPRQLIVYADSRHSVGNVPAANIGPYPLSLVADWLVARLSGKPFASERWFVEANGKINKTAY
jgi:pimeloyl-ACP methyl ester carboxylesterase